MKKEKSRCTPQNKKREYYEQLYANELDNLEDMNNFLETYSLPKPNPKEIDQLNRLNTRNETEYIIKKSPYKKKRVQDQMASQANSTKNTKRNLYPYSLNFS